MQDKEFVHKKEEDKELLDENMAYNGPGLDKQGALYMARQVSETASPCEYCNRGDCIECRFAY